MSSQSVARFKQFGRFWSETRRRIKGAKQTDPFCGLWGEWQKELDRLSADAGIKRCPLRLTLHEPTGTLQVFVSGPPTDGTHRGFTVGQVGMCLNGVMTSAPRVGDLRAAELRKELEPYIRMWEAWCREQALCAESGLLSVPEPPKTSATLTEVVLVAGASFEEVCGEATSLMSRREQYDWLKHNGSDAYDGARMPVFETWDRYVRRYLHWKRGPQNSPRAGRQHGSSVVTANSV